MRHIYNKGFCFNCAATTEYDALVGSTAVYCCDTKECIDALYQAQHHADSEFDEYREEERKWERYGDW